MKKTKKVFRPEIDDKEDKKLEKKKLLDELRLACSGLFYISETDAEIRPFDGKKADEVSGKELLRITGKSENCPVEIRDFQEIFDRLTKTQDWHSFAEKETVKRFLKLSKILKTNLSDLKVLKLGSINIEVYIVGLDRDSNLVGIKTDSVET